jgi:hypothetical protein
MSADPRLRAQRRRDTEHRLTHHADVWASASADGAPYLVPLSFDWGGEAASRVGFNLPARAAKPGGRLWVIASGATRHRCSGEQTQIPCATGAGADRRPGRSRPDRHKRARSASQTNRSDRGSN